MKHEPQKSVSDTLLIESYLRTGSVWKTAGEFGLCGQNVYERLNKLGVVKHMNLWTEAENQRLLDDYLKYKEENRLDKLAEELGRTKQFICRKAKLLGLTNNKKRHLAQQTRLKLSEAKKEWLKTHEHPRGYLGHKHSKETLKKMSLAISNAWKDPNSVFNTDDFRQKQSDNLHLRKINGEIDAFSIRGKFPTIIGDSYYVFKSSWEKTIAEQLQTLKNQQVIQKWEYESKHFIFHDIKRGIRSYCPDFEVTLADGNKMYIEVKGWKMDSSMKRISMFIERYPNVKFYLLDSDEYQRIISESDYLRRRCV